MTNSTATKQHLSILDQRLVAIQEMGGEEARGILMVKTYIRAVYWDMFSNIINMGITNNVDKRLTDKFTRLLNNHSMHPFACCNWALYEFYGLNTNGCYERLRKSLNLMKMQKCYRDNDLFKSCYPIMEKQLSEW